jgi:ABC-type glycerol-3-phosphate transport system substrate-binding protein
VWAYVVNKDTKNAEWAWRWVQFLTSKDAQIKWFQKAGDLPSLKALVSDPSLATDEKFRIALESMTYSRPVEQVGQTEVDNIQSELWEKIVIQGADVEAAVKEAAAKEEQVVRKILKCP